MASICGSQHIKACFESSDRQNCQNKNRVKSQVLRDLPMVYCAKDQHKTPTTKKQGGLLIEPLANPQCHQGVYMSLCEIYLRVILSFIFTGRQLVNLVVIVWRR